jgi:hypothetical protein
MRCNCMSVSPSPSRLLLEPDASAPVAHMSIFKSLSPKPVLNVFMKARRFGMVAEINDQQSSHSARARVGTHASSAWSAEEILPIYAACKMESATTLEMLVCIRFPVRPLVRNLPKSECKRRRHLCLQVKRKTQGPDDHHRDCYQYEFCCCVESRDQSPLAALSIVS